MPSSALGNILFVSQGMQIFMFLFLVLFIMVFMKFDEQNRKIDQLERQLDHYVTKEEYMATFNSMWDIREDGDDVFPVQADLDTA